MPALALLLAMALLSLPLSAAAAPAYTSASIVNAATNQPGPLAPLGLVSLYGTDLAFVTRALTGDDVRSGVLPTTLIGTGVSITVDNIAVPILFASPNQVNFLIPGNLRTGKRKLRLVLNGRTGPDVDIEIADTAPGLFPFTNGLAIATHADGSLLTPDSPGAPGEVIILYAAGLGVTQPAFGGLSIPNLAASISARAQLAVLLNGEAIPDSAILYAGVTPGFAGLYQINCKLPTTIGLNPEIRLRLPAQTSPPGLRIAVRAPAGIVQ